MKKLTKKLSKTQLIVLAVAALLLVAGLVCLFVFRPWQTNEETPAGGQGQYTPPTPEEDPMPTEPLSESTLVKKGEVEGDFVFDLYEDYSVVTKYKADKTSVDVPASLGGKSVMAIGEQAFASKTILTSVTLPETLREIGNMAFYGCELLSDITLPASVHSVGDYAFASCLSLKNVTMKKGVKSIGIHAFDETAYLKNNTEEYMIVGDGILLAYHGEGGSITLPSDVKRINSLSFCETITALYIPTGVTHIGGYALSGCSNIATVSIPATVTYVGERAFTGCASLLGVRLGEGVKEVGEAAFSFCDNLKSVNYPESVEKIGDNQFELTETIEVLYVTEGSYAESYFQKTEYASLLNNESE